MFRISKPAWHAEEGQQGLRFYTIHVNDPIVAEKRQGCRSDFR